MDKPVEKCAVFGGSNVPGAAEIARIALDAQNHRGQDATGIAVLGEGGQFDRYGGEGLVMHAYDPEVTARHAGRTAVGQNLYTTSDGKIYTQPTSENNGTFALAHNGNLSHTERLRADLDEHRITMSGTNDSKQSSLAMGWRMARGATLEDAAADTYSLIADAGSFSIVAADKSGTLIAMRDPRGYRPMSIGWKGGGFVVASETFALDEVGADYWRDVEPGELVIFDDNGPRSRQLAEPDPKLCMTEFVYVAHPKSRLLGRVVEDVRYNFGRTLALEQPAEADIVVPVPNTAIPAALGYAEQSGIPYLEALTIAREAKGIRSFMGRTAEERRKAIAKKLVLAPGSVEGKHAVVVDDSIFRGNAQKRVIEMLRQGGAKSVHVRIASPPIRNPNGLGVATPTTTELIAFGKSVDEVRVALRADSLGYESLRGMVAATGHPMSRFNLSDFTGENEIVKIHARNRSLVAALR